MSIAAAATPSVPHAFPVRTDADHERALAMIAPLMERAELSSAELDFVEVMGLVIADYEERTNAVPTPDPVALIEFYREQQGWSQRELARQSGLSSGTLNEVLKKRRRLPLSAIRRLAALGVPADLLIQPYQLDGRK